MLKAMPWKIVILVFMLAFTGVTEARADVASELNRIDHEFKDLPIGKPREALQAWLKARIDRAALPAIAAANDYAEKEGLRARRDQQLAILTQGEVHFDVAETLWEVSLIAGEFGRGTDESMIVWRQPGETLYFFLQRGVLWKVARQLELAKSFEHHHEHWSGVLKSKGTITAKGNNGPTEIRWPSETLDVRLLNRRLLYGGDLLVIESRALAKELAAKRAEVVMPAAKKANGADDLDDFFLPETER